jgi:hypothetical protein
MQTQFAEWHIEKIFKLLTKLVLEKELERSKMVTRGRKQTA